MQRLSLQVTGMNCGHCEDKVKKAVGQLDGVSTVEADHQSGIVLVDAEPVNRPAIEAAITDAGYAVVPA